MSGKINRMITVDPEIWDKFQRLFPNQASSFCNEQMRLRIAYSQGDLNNVDIELLKVQEREVLQKVDLANSELSQIREKLNLVTAEAEKEEKARLEAERARLEAMTKCSGCGCQMQKPHLKAGGEQFCKSCFMSDHPKVIEAVERDKA